MAIYRELFYNNVEGFIAGAFPILRAITPDALWHARVRRFFAEHRSHTPYFAEIAAEFLAWLNTPDGTQADDPQFLRELAHYEWVELALQISDADRSAPPLDHNGDLRTGRPIVSPLAWPLAYSYPVHRIGLDFQPQQPGEQPSFLVVYRDRRDEIHFLEINAVTYRLLALLQECPEWTGLEAVTRIAEELQHPQSESVIQHGLALLAELRERNIIIGTRA